MRRLRQTLLTRCPPALRWGLALGYVLGVVSVPLVDAWAQAAALEAETHIEAASDEYHVVGHDELLCQVCRLMDLSGDRHQGSRMHVATPVRVADGMDHAGPSVSPPVHPQVRPRAPPIS